MEAFFKNYQYTLLAFSGIGTWVAAFIALWISNKPTKVVLKVSLSEKSQADQDKTNLFSNLEIKITNKGRVPAYIDKYVYLSRRFFQDSHRIYIITDEKRDNSMEIQPNITVIGAFYGDNLSIILKGGPKLLKSYIYSCYLQTVEGEKFKVKVPTYVKKQYFKNSLCKSETATLLP